MKNLNLWGFIYFLPSFFVVTLFLFHIDLGIDITDEGFYLVNTQHAAKDLNSSTHFFHYTNILWSLSNKNITLFRAYGLLCLVLSASFLTCSIIRYLRISTNTFIASRIDKTLWYTSANTSVLVYYYSWLTTPSYNWLALLCCLITLGLLLRLISLTPIYNKPSSHNVLLICILLGLFLTIAFVAKPTTMVVLSVLILVVILFSPCRKHWLEFCYKIGLSASVSFLLHVLIFEKGFFLYISNVTADLQYAKIELGYEILPKTLNTVVRDLSRLPSYTLENVRLAFYFVFVMFFLNIAHVFFPSILSKHNSKLNVVLMLTLIVVAWSELFVTQHWSGGTILGRKIAFGGLTLLVVLMFGILATKLRELFGLNSNSFFKHFALLVFSLVLCNFAYSLGSTTGFLRQGCGAFVFLALALVFTSVWSEANQNQKLVSSLISFLVICSSFLVFTGAYNTPYRLESSLSEQRQKVTFLGTNSSLLVSPANANYINSLKQLAVSNGWKENSSFLDMTGGTPLAAFILNGVPPKRAWLLGGYQGSDAAARWIFEQSDIVTLKNSWVLTAPEGKREISISTLEVGDIEFEKNYELVGELETAHRREKQYLWRPRTH